MKENKSALKVMKEIILLARFVTWKANERNYSKEELLKINRFLSAVLDCIHNLPEAISINDIQTIEKEYEYVKRLDEDVEHINFIHDYKIIKRILQDCLNLIIQEVEK